MGVKGDNERLRLQGFLHCVAQDAIDDIDEDNLEDIVEMHFPSSLLKKAKSELFSSTPNLDESAISSTTCHSRDSVTRDFQTTMIQDTVLTSSPKKRYRRTRTTTQMLKNTPIETTIHLVQ